MNGNVISYDMINMELRQMGATNIESNATHIVIVDFDISEDMRISYLYNVKDENDIYLQRIEPYPIRKTKMHTEEDVISFIDADIKKFKRAYQSSKFSIFLNLINKVSTYDEEIEDLFLRYNIEREYAEALDSCLDKMHDTMIDIENNCEKFEQEGV